MNLHIRFLFESHKLTLLWFPIMYKTIAKLVTHMLKYRSQTVSSNGITIFMILRSRSYKKSETIFSLSYTDMPHQAHFSAWNATLSPWIFNRRSDWKNEGSRILNFSLVCGGRQGNNFQNRLLSHISFKKRIVFPLKIKYNSGL